MARVPTQLCFPGADDWSPHPPGCEPHPRGCELPSCYEDGRLFDMAPLTARASTPSFAGAVGDAAEIIFQGICTAYDLVAYRAPAGHQGHDFLVNGLRVQVKGTRVIRKDGRLNFNIGRKGRRFVDYAGAVDYFAFVSVVPGADFHGRLLVMAAADVLRRWKGSNATMYPTALPKTPDLSLLMSDAATVDAVEGGGGDLERTYALISC